MGVLAVEAALNLLLFPQHCSPHSHTYMPWTVASFDHLGSQVV